MQKSLRVVLSVVLVALCLVVVAQPAAAQRGASNVVRVYYTEPKDGNAAAYEQGRIRHMEIHKKLGDTWAWHTWQVETGDDGGAYYTVTFGHKWADFDMWDAKFAEADGADAAKNLAPVSGEGSNWFGVSLDNVSAPATTPFEPTPLTELIHFTARQGMNQEFMNAIRKVHDAIQKTKWTDNYTWYAHTNGRNANEYVLAIGLKNWADMEEPEMSFPAMLEKAVGRTEADAVMKSIDSSILRQRSEMLRYRKDLSYIPAAK